MKLKASFIVVGVVAILILLLSGSIFEVNTAGYFQVKQAVISGDMSARMTPGLYGQVFGDILTYKAVATIGYGDEIGEGSADIGPVNVIFNDGSKAEQSGLVRVRLPQDEDQAIQLRMKYANGYDHFIRAGVLPVVKNAVKLAANLRSAQDAYTTLAVYQEAINDQLKNGIYKTRSDTKEFKNSVGEIEIRKVTEIVRDESGQPVRISNMLGELGCEVLECVVSIPKFDALVEEMIAKRKQQKMETDLAKQTAIRAKQDRITAEESGKAAVMKVKYEMEKEKQVAVTNAEKDKKVAELGAEQKLNVAKLDKQAAKEYKVMKILQADADATYKRKVMQADGALAQKLATYEKVQATWASAFENVKVNLVPQMNMGGGSSRGNNAATDFMSLMTAKSAKDLMLDMKPSGK